MFPNPTLGPQRNDLRSHGYLRQRITATIRAAMGLCAGQQPCRPAPLSPPPHCPAQPFVDDTFHRQPNVRFLEVLRNQGGF